MERGEGGELSSHMCLKTDFSFVKSKKFLKNAKNSTKSPPPAFSL